MTNFSDKHELRRLLRRKRQSLNTDYRQQATTRINRFLYRLIRRQKRIAVYWSVSSELSLWPLIVTAQQRGAQVYLPYIEANKRQLWFTPCPHLRRHPTKRYLHQYNLQPRKRTIPQFGGAKIRARYLNTLIMPLLGIDSYGHRLGQGGGYYDASLATHHEVKPLLVGTGFSCQQVKMIKTEKHDINIPLFVCEHGYQYFKYKAR